MAFTPKTKMIAKRTGEITSKYAAPGQYVQPDVAPPVTPSAAPITTATTTKRDIRTGIPGFSPAPSVSGAGIPKELAFAIGAGGAALTNYLKKSAEQRFGQDGSSDFTGNLVPGSMEPGGSMSGLAQGPVGPIGAPVIPSGTPALPVAPSGTSTLPPRTPTPAVTPPAAQTDLDKLGAALKAAILGGATTVAVDKIFSTFGLTPPPGSTVKDKIGNVLNTSAKQATGSVWDSIKSWWNDATTTPPTSISGGVDIGGIPTEQPPTGPTGPTPEGGPDITGLPPSQPTGEGSTPVDSGQVGQDGVPANQETQAALAQPQIEALGDGYFYDATTDTVFKVNNGELIDATQEFAAILNASQEDFANWGINFDGDFADTNFDNDLADTNFGGVDLGGGDQDFSSDTTADSGGDNFSDIFDIADIFDYGDSGEEYGAKGGLFTLKKGKRMATGGIAHMAGGGQLPPGSNTEYYSDGSSVTRDADGFIIEVLDADGNDITEETINRVAAYETGHIPQSLPSPGYVSDAEQIAIMNAKSVYGDAENPANRDIYQPSSIPTPSNLPTATAGGAAPTGVTAPTGGTAPTGATNTPSGANAPPQQPDPQSSSFLNRIRNILGNEYVQGGITATMLAQLLNGAEDKGNKGVNVSDYAIQGGRTTDFGMGPARKVSLGPATALDPDQQNEIYANLGVPGYTAQTENITAPAKARGGAIHYTYGKHIDPLEVLGVQKRSGGLASVNPESGVPMVQGRHDYRKGAYVQGAGDGQSDDIPAMLADGEYVIDAELVSMLGNGSNKAGAKVLDGFRKAVREHKRSAPLGKIPPKAKSPLQYLKGV